MDVQKVQINDLGASGFIPGLGSRYVALAKRITVLGRRTCISL